MNRPRRRPRREPAGSARIGSLSHAGPASCLRRRRPGLGRRAVRRGAGNQRRWGPPDPPPGGLQCRHVRARRPSGAEIDPADFERCWRVGCLGGFHVGQRAAQAMLAARPASGWQPHGSLFTGATASLRGGAGLPKSGGCPEVRPSGRSPSPWRGNWGGGPPPEGPPPIHVGHVVIDGQIETPSLTARSPDRDPAHHALEPDGARPGLSRPPPPDPRGCGPTRWMSGR